MPTLGLFADDLCRELSIDYSNTKAAEKEFDALCFKYGLELDEVLNSIL